MKNGCDRKKNLVWIDMEMTGLDPSVDVILEVALIITDAHLNILEEMDSIAVKQSQRTLQKMDEWNTNCHTRSGLVSRVLSSHISVSQAEDMLLSVIEKYCRKGALLCGSSIEQDRRFIRRYMNRLDQYLHYRHLNVSTLKEVIVRWYENDPLSVITKKQNHRALDDIRESLEELKYYRKHFFKPSFSNVVNEGL